MLSTMQINISHLRIKKEAYIFGTAQVGFLERTLSTPLEGTFLDSLSNWYFCDTLSINPTLRRNLPI